MGWEAGSSQAASNAGPRGPGSIRSLSLPWGTRVSSCPFPHRGATPRGSHPAAPPASHLPAAHREVGHGVVVGLQHLGVLEDVIPERVEPVEGDEEVGAGDPLLGAQEGPPSAGGPAGRPGSPGHTDRPRTDAFQGRCRSRSLRAGSCQPGCQATAWLSNLGEVARCPGPSTSPSVTRAQEQPRAHEGVGRMADVSSGAWGLVT